MQIVPKIRPTMLANDEPSRHAVSRVQRVHASVLESILQMEPLSFRAFCWAYRIGPFTPSLKKCNITLPGLDEFPDSECGGPVILEDGEARYCASHAKEMFEDGGILSPEAAERYRHLLS